MLSSPHAEDWTQLFGLSMFAMAYLMHAAHGSEDGVLKRTIARTSLLFTLSCALVMTWWQILPDRRWSRLDLVNVIVLYVMSYGMFRESGLAKKEQASDGQKTGTTKDSSGISRIGRE